MSKTKKTSKEYLIPMVDGGLLKYEDDCYKSCDGCPTCGCGEEYTTEIMMYFNDFNFGITIEDSGSIDQGCIMSIFIKNLDSIKRMTEEHFILWFKSKIEERYNSDNIKFVKYFDGTYEYI